MNSKSGNFFERHVEKLVLAVVGILCLYVLVTRVLISPNKVSLDNRQFNPGQVDQHVYERARLLEERLNRPAEPKGSYDPKVNAFDALVEGRLSGVGTSFAKRFPVISELYPEISQYAVQNIDATVRSVLPPRTSSEVSDDRKYRIPQIGAVADVSVAHIRTVAYVPVAEVDLENAYEESTSEPNDIDLVTVAGKFDVAELVESFHKCFAGDSVAAQWRDPCLAKPVFAAVHLQRQLLLDDDSWSGWQDVSRTRVEPRREMFEIIEDVEKLPPGGITVRTLKFDNLLVQMDLLQPEPYRIASAEEQWFPPSLHVEYLEYRKKVEAREREEAREAERKKKLRPREGTPGRPGSRFGEQMPGSRYEPGRTGRFGGQSGLYREPTSGRYPSRGGRPQPGRWGSDRSEEEQLLAQQYDRGGTRGSTGVGDKALNDLNGKFDKILINDQTGITKMDEPLVFWAYDDTVQPGQTYQYRIRLGVFNPVAGTEQISQENASFRNEVILWSQWSEQTDPAEIAAKLYFFPWSVQEAAKKVTVRVCRYAMGYWYMQPFPVKQGEIIGKAVACEPETEETTEDKKDIILPDTIDYSTGVVMVDVTVVNDWSGGTAKHLAQKYYHDMLYSLDGNGIDHMSIGFANWPRDMQNKFRELENAKSKTKKPFRAFGVSSRRSRFASRRGTGKRGTGEGEDTGRMEEDDGEYEQLMKMLGR